MLANYNSLTIVCFFLLITNLWPLPCIWNKIEKNLMTSMTLSCYRKYMLDFGRCQLGTLAESTQSLKLRTRLQSLCRLHISSSHLLSKYGVFGSRPKTCIFTSLSFSLCEVLKIHYFFSLDMHKFWKLSLASKHLRNKYF